MKYDTNYFFIRKNVNKKLVIDHRTLTLLAKISQTTTTYAEVPVTRESYHHQKYFVIG